MRDAPASVAIASAISSMLTSRTGWPIDQWWPNGSATTP